MQNKGIEGLIINALETMQKTYRKQKNIEKGNKENNFPSRLLFPYGRKSKKLRVSEQEAVFFFTREIEKNNKYFYAVEVPTRKPYLLKDKRPIIMEGSSGSIDVCVYDNPNTEDTQYLKYLIEFKEDMQGIYIDSVCDKDKCKLSLVKDFLRLRYDVPDIPQNYFVHIIENCNESKKDDLIKNYGDAFWYIDEYSRKKYKTNSNYSSKGSKIKIFVCSLREDDKGKIIQIDDSKDLDKLETLI